jgi:thiol-disulfide isomerase/thioredoxin
MKESIALKSFFSLKQYSRFKLKKMKTLILILFSSVFFFLNTQAQINYHISGSIDRRDIDKVFLNVNKTQIDSAIVKEGNFEMKGTYKNQAIAYILIKKPLIGNKIILDNGEYNIILDENLYPVNIESSSKNQNLWYNFVKSNELNASNKSKDSLLADYKLQIERGNYKLSDEYLAKYHVIQLKLLNNLKNLVNDHPDCYITPYFLINNNILTQENFGETFNKLSPEVRNNEWGVRLKALLDKKAVLTPDPNIFWMTILGTKAQSFETNQADGKKMNQASLKGKWVLLDFWASWCAPCRSEFPYLKKAQETFKGKNFVISSVSVDKDPAEWLKALLEEKAPPFIHSNLGEFGNSIGFKYYQVNAIPSNFLINPEGRIVALNLRGDDLIATLSKFIK